MDPKDWVVTIDPAIPGVRHTAFGPFTQEGAMNFQDSISQNFPGVKTLAQQMGKRITHVLGTKTYTSDEPEPFGQYAE